MSAAAGAAPALDCAHDGTSPHTRYPVGLPVSEAHAELLPVASYAQRIEADLAVSQLAAAGIEAIISGPDAGGTLPAVSGGIRVLVHQRDLANAEATLRREPAPSRPRKRTRISLATWIVLAVVAVALAWFLLSAF